MILWVVSMKIARKSANNRFVFYTIFSGQTSGLFCREPACLKSLM